MPKRAHYIIVDGHSIIFAWPELRKLHARRSSLAREALIKRLRDYQDWTGARVVVVFDGKGKETSAISEPGEVQIFYSRSGHQQMRLLSDWRANTQNSSISPWPLPIRWKRRPCTRVGQNGFLLTHYGRYFPARDDPRIPISSQSLLLVRKVSRAGDSRQSVALPPQAARPASPTKLRR